MVPNPDIFLEKSDFHIPGYEIIECIVFGAISVLNIGVFSALDTAQQVVGDPAAGIEAACTVSIGCVASVEISGVGEVSSAGVSSTGTSGIGEVSAIRCFWC